MLTVGDAANNGYRMVGIPDGLGAYDNHNGTFTVLINHELAATAGAVRAHGNRGAFISKWIIRKYDLAVLNGSDLIQNLKLWNPATSTYNTFNALNPASTGLNRFCSADLPKATAFSNPATGRGTQNKIFMAGEEAGVEGRAFGTIATGVEAGNSYELPRLGKFSWENAVANPNPSDWTIVAGTDDATPGQVYFYLGAKSKSGNDIDRAGLNNGNLYGPVITGFSTETEGNVPANGTAFWMANLGNAANMTGAQLEAASNAAGVARFLRPEDGQWDPNNPNDFYFVTTNGFNNPSRLWKLHFNDLNNLPMGGTVTVVLNGTEGQKMFDNMTIDNSGHILLQEDVGNNAHLGKIWQYTIGNGELKAIAQHDSLRFITGAPLFLTQDEESSGIIDVSSILGPGMFLTVVQAHYALPGELVEGGQLLAMINPGSISANDAGDNVLVCHNGSTISVPGNMVLTHLGHGDGLGYCEVPGARINQGTTSVEQQPSIKQMALYPNPASNKTTLAITLPEPAKVSISVHDVNGKQVMSLPDSRYNAGVNMISLNTVTLMNGTYIVRVITGKGVSNLKLVVVH